MASITETEFDKLVKHTIRIDFTDGTVLIYTVSVEEKQSLINQLRKLSFGIETERQGTRLIFFSTSPARIVFINTAYMLRLIFCFDSPGNIKEYLYKDNFGVLNLNEKDEHGHAVKDEEGEIYLPQAIIKLIKPVGYQDSDILTFGSLDAGDLIGLEMEVENPDDGLREFIELIDDDGENNFIPLRHIMCMEVEKELMCEEDMEEEE